jgi:gliding motility-associated-like protein
MRNTLIILFYLFLSTYFISAQSIYNNDTIVCDSYQGDLVAVSATGDDISGDDDYSGIIAIGFPFTFYGTVYNSLLISDNGYVTFDLTNALGYSPWPINTVIPNVGSDPENAIMTPWQDLYLPAGGKCFYALEGSAPNRRFLISWCNVAMFSCNTSFSTLQIVLHEGSNKIETFIEDKPLCSSWNSGTAVHGLVSANSTYFNIVTDPILLQPRNYPLQWTASNEGWEFIPNGSTSYTINPISFVPVVAALVDWFDSNGNLLGSGPILSVNITTSTTFYTSLTGDCFGSSNTDSVTIRIISPNVDLGPDIFIACNSDTILNPILFGGIGSYTYNWNTGSVDSMITVNGGTYNVIILDSLGCTDSDEIIVTENPSPSFDFGVDYSIPCNTTTTINPNIFDGIEPYSYSWNDGSSNSLLIVSEGIISLVVSDIYGCIATDEIIITQDAIPHATILGGGSVCDDGTTVDISFTFNGLLPWDLTYTNGTASTLKNDIPTFTYTISTSIAGLYGIELADDINDCVADTIGGTVEVIVNPLPVAEITPNDITIYIGDEIELTAGEYTFYEWYTVNDSLLSVEQILTVTDSGRFYIWVEDEFGCTDASELAIVRAVPLTQLYVPTVFTPNDDEHNEHFVIKGLHIVHFNIQIFTRWGELVFESNSIDKYWDGLFENNRVPEGSYYYQIDVLGKDKKSFTKGGMIQVIY